MITFKVVKETYGWAIRTGECMSTLFWAREAAIREANRLAEAIKRHGECAQVVIEGGGASLRAGSASTPLGRMFAAQQ